MKLSGTIILVTFLFLGYPKDGQGRHRSLNHKYLQGNNTDEAAALRFLVDYDKKASVVCNFVMSSQWNYNTNITDVNRQQMQEAQLEYAKFQKEVWKLATSFAWKNFRDSSIRRQFKVLSVLGRAALEDDKLSELQKLLGEMRDSYAQTKICDYKIEKPKRSDCNLPLEPDLTRIMSKSRDFDELLFTWKAWHDASGQPIREKFNRYVELSNEAASLNGFKDHGDYWRSAYDTPDFEEQLENLWYSLRPLYHQLHAYVRRKLVQEYGEDKIDPEGPIPAHLLGNMWAQSWTNILDLTLPFPEKQSIDVTEAMMAQGYTPSRIFKMADDFFASLGMKSVSEDFWEKSMLWKPEDRDVVCHASAWDFCDRADFRIKQCTEVTMEDFVTAHHEMGHIQYYLQYVDQPLVFREGANPGFHEAVGDAISLSVITPSHLRQVGLLNKEEDDYENDMNFLFTMGMEKIAFMPFGYLLDKWRWKVFSGDISPERLNEAWWDYRIKYQGISPPVNRTEENFDAGAKYHVPSNIPYIRYFVSFVLQFQLHQAMCDAAGYEGPLYKCDIYKSKEAGRLLSSVLALGSAKPSPEAIRILTNGRTTKMDAAPILEYFEPLMRWLEEENAESPLGWRGENGADIKTSIGVLITIVLPIISRFILE
ncbi:angiotensin-converting enzyme-like [Artemia franciscana]|uniref:angiotensin-converting enzyme-like n=1 Tax=Artemia franciscana TaxID=6661 RepID=UPI0032DAF8A2